MLTTSVCISGRNGNDKWRQKVWFCNSLRSFGAEGGFGGHHNPIPKGEQREDVEETTTPIPTGKLVPGIKGAEALPGRYQHRAQGMWQELAGFPTRNDVAGLCSRSIAWINLPHTGWDRLVPLPCQCIGHFQGGKSISNFRT